MVMVITTEIFIIFTTATTTMMMMMMMMMMTSCCGPFGNVVHAEPCFWRGFDPPPPRRHLEMITVEGFRFWNPCDR